ncbi:MAG: polysaccharide biosynthesis protein, partial [Cyanobacteria bacterium J06636_27]
IPAVSIFQIVIIFAYARGFMSILGTALNATNKPNINALINWILVPLSIPAFFVGANLGGVTGVAIAVAVVMGIGASVWFWLAVSHTSRWNILKLLKPVILPTSSITITLLIAINLPLAPSFKTFLQPLLLIVIYTFLISILSAGRIPKSLFDVIKKTLNKK